MIKRNILMIEMTIFFLVVFGCFSYIILNEKQDVILKPKANEKLLNYIDKNYNDIKDNFNISKTFYNNNDKSFYINISDKNNNNLSFKVLYSKKKYSDTYKKDYIEGKSLYNYLNNKFTKDLSNKTYNTNINFIKKLNKYNEINRDKIINHSNIKELSIYNISTSFEVDKYNKTNIEKKILKFYKICSDKNYNPKEYEFIIINNEDNNINQSVKISKLTKELIINNLDEIINGIINDDISISNKYEIEYEYLY